MEESDLRIRRFLKANHPNDASTRRRFSRSCHAPGWCISAIALYAVRIVGPSASSATERTSRASARFILRTARRGVGSDELSVYSRKCQAQNRAQNLAAVDLGCSKHRSTDCPLFRGLAHRSRHSATHGAVHHGRATARGRQLRESARAWVNAGGWTSVWKRVIVGAREAR